MSKIWCLDIYRDSHLNIYIYSGKRHIMGGGGGVKEFKLSICISRVSQKPDVF